MALTAALLLLGCHGLDGSFHVGHATRVSHPLESATTALAVPAPPPEAPLEVSCCFGGTGSNLLSVTLTRLPQLAAPLLAALLSAALLLAALPRLRPAPQRAIAHRTSLVAQAVLLRI